MIRFLVSSSVFILLVILLRQLCRKYISKRIQYMLWLLVAVKLLIFPVPWLESTISIFNIPDKLAAALTLEQDASAAADKSPEAGNAADAVVGEENIVNTKTPVMESPKAQQQAEGRSRPVQIVLGMIAMSGTIVFLSFWIVTNWKFGKYLKENRREQNGYEADLPFAVPLTVYVVEKLPSPCLYRKAVYVTPECMEDSVKLRHILVHEYSHYKQGDGVWSMLRGICLCVYWWHPLVWAAVCLSKQDCELSCDEAALKYLGDEERLSYGETLLALIGGRPGAKDYFSAATTMVSGKRSLKQRILAISKKTHILISVCVLVIAAVVIGLAATSTSKLRQEVNDTEENTEADAVEAYTAEEIWGWFNGTGAPEVDSEAEPVWSDDHVIYYLPVKDQGMKDLRAFLLKYFEEDTVDELLRKKIGDYRPFIEIDGVLYRGEGLVGNDDGGDPQMTADELQQWAQQALWEGDVTWELNIFHISDREKCVDDWEFYEYGSDEDAFYAQYNELKSAGEIAEKSIGIDEQGKFYMDEQVGSSAPTEVSYEKFLSYISEREQAVGSQQVSAAECFCRIKDGMIVSMELKNPYSFITNIGSVSGGMGDYETYGTDAYTLQNVYEVNLNRDVDEDDSDDLEKNDRLEVYTGNTGDGANGMVLIYSGDPANEPYNIEAHTARAGWTSIYLVNLAGKDYIFQLYIEDRDEFGELRYVVYSFGEQAGSRLGAYVMEGAAFAWNGEVNQDSFDKWAERMEAYLKDATLLLSSQDGEIRVGPGNDFERYNSDELLREIQ